MRFRQLNIYIIASTLFLYNLHRLLNQKRITQPLEGYKQWFKRNHNWVVAICLLSGIVAYVYLCYGMHHLFNVVTNKKNIPHAVLIRSIEPLEGLEYMLQRRGFTKPKYNLTAGPGAMSKALGIFYNKHTGLSLNDNTIWIENRGIKIKLSQIIATPRIGVQYAAEDALLPFRFIIKDNPWCSKLILKAPKNLQSGSSNAL